MTCPRCNGELRRDDYHGKICFRCADGHGVGMTLGGLRSLCGSTSFVNTLWQTAYHRTEFADTVCPVCGKKMKKIILPLNGNPLELDVCCCCQMIWFDPQELESIPLAEVPKQPELPQQAREVLAKYEAQRAEKNICSSYWEDEHAPSNGWKAIPAVFGFPVEKEAPEMNSRPWLTWGLALLCLAIFLCTFANLRSVIDAWGFIPAERWRHGGLTFLTSMFLHGGIAHIIGNVYFLLIFGDNVEDAFGKRRYLFLILISGLTATGFYLLFRSASPVPCVGASGFISGVIAAYSVCFPQVTISFLIRPRYTFRCYWIGIPAWAAFGLWLIFQLLMAYLTRENTGGGVAYTAHIGGAIPGVLFALYLRFRQKHTAEDFSKKLDDYRNVK